MAEQCHNNNILEAKDKKYTWHPFTQMQEWAKEEILIIDSGDGPFLRDVSGAVYIDGVASLWTNVHGHRKKELDEALIEQVGKISHSTFLGLSHVPAIELAEKLVSLLPTGLRRIFYADSGSEAMEVAIKVAYQYHCQKKNPEPQRKKFVHLDFSYHGDTLGSVSIGGIDLFHKVYKPLIFDTLRIPAPYCYRCPYDLDRQECSSECTEALSELLAHNADEIAAVIVEPCMQGAAGMIDQPRGFLARIRELTEQYSVLLICDEVATGFGRTGALFACERENVVPDIMALGKGITGGYLPLSATAFKEEIFEAFLGEHTESKSFFHGHTYTANQLAARVACANIELFEKEDIINSLQPKIKHLSQRLAAVREYAHVGDIRQVGFMVGIELVADKKTKEAYPPQLQIGQKVIQQARKNGAIIRPLGDVIVLMPPLSIPLDVLDRLIDITAAAIRAVTE
jgi:adenosylmethionine---8-amino-7-oxononanoate aminotransferase